MCDEHRHTTILLVSSATHLSPVLVDMVDMEPGTPITTVGAGLMGRLSCWSGCSGGGRSVKATRRSSGSGMFSNMVRSEWLVTYACTCALDSATYFTSRSTCVCVYVRLALGYGKGQAYELPTQMRICLGDGCHTGKTFASFNSLIDVTRSHCA